MDSLRQQAKDKFFSEQKFSLQSGTHHVARSLIHRVTRTSPELDSQKPAAGLLLVRINRHPYGELQITQDIFLDLFTAFKLEPYVLHMLQRESYGLMDFQSESSIGSEKFLDTFNLKSISVCLIWSYNHSSRWTRGILIPRHSDSVGDSCEIFRTFAKTLELQRDLVAHPWLLRFVALLETHRWIESILTNELQTIRQAESQTGYGCWESWNRGHGKTWKPQLGNFAEMSQIVGFSTAALANVLRHIEIADEFGDIAPLLTEAAGRSCALIREGGSGLGKAAEALKLVRKQVAAREKDTRYLQERARNQLSVMFNLINQNDATTSLQIASSAKDNSASMKVVALMTIFFLPRTFFATLFAVPTLTWSEDVVVSSRFWIYWAFTLPCTLLLVALYKGWGWGWCPIQYVS
ncbi:hypothetical protein EPUS_07323 [Endocarpon pusillum Z07020]|uniref:Uncharacterized protein n=1 Tax=Endocarpon pusillum (strain Z07020 / HMAS-L-300199) TaxID=1263415 RepID=U1GVD9_ENDPU|nr:uncharacterized protein EPUS_07323 [Endocarpon pusillum Z07020]ERF76443.1 hypothetical protein EPUS_07323 [Endocarpon pusillum Z07020]